MKINQLFLASLLVCPFAYGCEKPEKITQGERHISISPMVLDAMRNCIKNNPDKKARIECAKSVRLANAPNIPEQVFFQQASRDLLEKIEVCEKELQDSEDLKNSLNNIFLQNGNMRTGIAFFAKGIADELKASKEKSQMDSFIEPTPSHFNENTLKHYKDISKELTKNNIKPRNFKGMDIHDVMIAPEPSDYASKHVNLLSSKKFELKAAAGLASAFFGGWLSWDLLQKAYRGEDLASRSFGSQYTFRKATKTHIPLIFASSLVSAYLCKDYYNLIKLSAEIRNSSKKNCEK